jgi:hypothetical protein
MGTERAAENAASGDRGDELLWHTDTPSGPLPRYGCSQPETEHLPLAQPELDAEQRQWLRDAGSRGAASANREELRKSA